MDAGTKGSGKHIKNLRRINREDCRTRSLLRIDLSVCANALLLMAMEEKKSKPSTGTMDLAERVRKKCNNESNGKDEGQWEKVWKESVGDQNCLEDPWWCPFLWKWES